MIMRKLINGEVAELLRTKYNFTDRDILRLVMRTVIFTQVNGVTFYHKVIEGT